MEISYTIISFGGASNENEVSVITGTMACNVLKRAGRNILPLYISQEGEFFAGGELADIALFKGEGYKKAAKAIIADRGIYTLSKRGKIKAFFKADCLLNCCHGGSGEGGGLSGLCAMAGIPLAGSDEFASSAFLNKYYTKLVLEALGVRTAPFKKITSADDKESLASLGFPLIIKPLTLGSSIGVEKVENPEELAEALNTAFALDGGAIAEKYLFPRREINCAAYRTLLGVQVTECEESLFGGGVFTFEDKYGGGGRSVFPADIPQELSSEIKDITKRVFAALGMRGIARFDFIVCGGEIYLSEVNTVPGSLSQYLVSRSYREFGEVLLKIIEEARASFYGGKKAIITTGILRNIPSNACKMRPK